MSAPRSTPMPAETAPVQCRQPTPLAPARVIERTPKGSASSLPAALHIDRLVLDGVTLGPGDRQRLQAGLEAEWRALASSRSAAGIARYPGMALARLRIGDIRIDEPADAESIGRAIARSLHAGVRP